MRIHNREPNAREIAALSTEPERDEAMSFVIECWHDLDSCRSIGFSGAGPIPWTAVVDWCAFHGADGDVTEMVAEAIRYCDVMRAERLASEQRAQEQKAKAKR